DLSPTAGHSGAPLRAELTGNCITGPMPTRLSQKGFNLGEQCKVYRTTSSSPSSIRDNGSTSNFNSHDDSVAIAAAGSAVAVAMLIVLIVVAVVSYRRKKLSVPAPKPDTVDANKETIVTVSDEGGVGTSAVVVSEQTTSLSAKTVEDTFAESRGPVESWSNETVILWAQDKGLDFDIVDMLSAKKVDGKNLIEREGISVMCKEFGLQEDAEGRLLNAVS
ncbi:hypothetical protein HDU76_009955, partial [Blyttiomyces sp. JEL0837]